MPNLPSAFKSSQGEARYMAAYEAGLRLWTIPYEEKDIPGRFGSTHLVACGSKNAPPLVLLHSAMANLTAWAYNIADLSRDYRVYALDEMGQPNKSIPDQPIRGREDCVEWLTTILNALGIDRTHMAGVSYGGWLALNFAIRAPERLNKLVLLSPAGSFMPLVPQFYLRGMLLLLPPRRFWMSKFVGWLTYRANLQEPNTRKMFDCLVEQMYLGLRYFKMQAGVNPIAFKDDELRGVKNSALLLIGQQEVIYDPAASVERARRLMPAVQAELIPEARHDMVFSRARMVNQKILGLLKE
jgi:pimeloyl-ACP methyl ester carboxylesterase